MSSIADLFQISASIRPIDVLYYSVCFIVSLIIGQVIYNMIEHYFFSKKRTKSNWKPMKIHDIDLKLNGVHYPVSYWSEQGRRPYQEDAFDAFAPSLHVKNESETKSKHIGIKPYEISKSNTTCLYGIYDGHGGGLASAFCKTNLLKYICESLDRITPESMSNVDIDIDDDERLNAEVVIRMKESCFRLNVAYCDSAKLNSLQIGTTAVVAMLYQVPLSKTPKKFSKRVSVANIGDSRAVLVQRGGKVVPLSVDHKPNREDERDRVMKLGGKITYNKYSGIHRVGGILAVSRAIGDLQLHPYVICEPEIVTREVETNDLFVVLASDGLWDVMSNEDVGMFVHKKYIKYANTNTNNTNPNSKINSNNSKMNLNSTTTNKESVLSSKNNLNQNTFDSNINSNIQVPVTNTTTNNTMNTNLKDNASTNNISPFAFIAKQLCEEATILGSTDNITVQVIDLSKFHQ